MASLIVACADSAATTQAMSVGRYDHIRTERTLFDENVELQRKLLQQKHVIARIDRSRTADISRLVLENQKREIEQKLQRLDEDEERAVVVDESELCQLRLNTNKLRELALIKEKTYIKKNKKNPFVQDARRST